MATTPTSVPDTGGIIADGADFRSIFRRHAAGVAIVTAAVDGAFVGMTVTSLISVSADPPIIAFSLSAKSSATPPLRRARTMVMHLLGSGHVDLATRFATSGIDRFDGLDWELLDTGDPVLADVESWMRCRVVDLIPTAGSTVVIAAVERVVGAEMTDRHEPLVYWDRTWHGLREESRL